MIFLLKCLHIRSLSYQLGILESTYRKAGFLTIDQSQQRIMAISTSLFNCRHLALNWGKVHVDSMTGMQTPLQFEICMSGHQQICICKYFLPPSAGPHHLTTLLEIIAIHYDLVLVLNMELGVSYLVQRWSDWFVFLWFKNIFWDCKVNKSID